FALGHDARGEFFAHAEHAAVAEDVLVVVAELLRIQRLQGEEAVGQQSTQGEGTERAQGGGLWRRLAVELAPAGFHALANAIQEISRRLVRTPARLFGDEEQRRGGEGLDLGRWWRRRLGFLRLGAGSSHEQPCRAQAESQAKAWTQENHGRQQT